MPCCLRWHLCGTHCLGLGPQPCPTFQVGHRTWSHTAPKQSLDALHPWRWFIQETPGRCLRKFKMVLTLIWKLKFYMSPERQCFEHVPKRELSPRGCSPRAGAAQFPNPWQEYFSFHKKTAPSPCAKVVLPSTTNLITLCLKIPFQQWKGTVLASEKGLLHK